MNGSVHLTDCVAEGNWVDGFHNTHVHVWNSLPLSSGNTKLSATLERLLETLIKWGTCKGWLVETWWSIRLLPSEETHRLSNILPSKFTREGSWTYRHCSVAPTSHGLRFSWVAICGSRDSSRVGQTLFTLGQQFLESQSGDAVSLLPMTWSGNYFGMLHWFSEMYFKHSFLKYKSPAAI